MDGCLFWITSHHETMEKWTSYLFLYSFIFASYCKFFASFSDSYRLILDPNTASVNLLLSEEKSKVSWIRNAQKYPHHPERFTSYDQVLCTEGLFGVCYWEVEWHGPRVEVAVCYKGADLEESGFGDTDHSWCISLSNSGCSFWHDQNKTKIDTPCSSTVAVYLNYKAGSLSFYSVSGSGLMTLLQRVQTTFSQPLYPGFMVSRGSSVRIVSPSNCSLYSPSDFKAASSLVHSVKYALNTAAAKKRNVAAELCSDSSSKLHLPMCWIISNIYSVFLCDLTYDGMLTPPYTPHSTLLFKHRCEC